MRQRFEQQFKLGTLQIADLEITFRTRDAQPKLVMALVEIFKTPEYNQRIFTLLENEICDKNKHKNTGRPGMDLWQIFVLGMFRLGLNLSYDRLLVMVNSDKMLRQLLGIETESGFKVIEMKYQTVRDNVDLLEDEFLYELNRIIVDFGNKEVFKKKAEDALRSKTDSFVVKSNVHYPTDYNLLWDCARKSIGVVGRFLIKYPEVGNWRKRSNWYRELKIGMRVLGQAIGSKGKYREANILKTATAYIEKAKLLDIKIQKTLQDLKIVCHTVADYKHYFELEQYHAYLRKHIDLVERRLIKGEQIPHHEKMFSIFETYTEYIIKGKQNPNFELGKRFAITTNQFGLIEDYQVMNKVCDSEIVIGIADRILSRDRVESWSFDKGYFSKENKELLQLEVKLVVMPKKGKCNKAEAIEESNQEFKRLRNKHSAIESNINELEHRGLDRCPDKGEAHFDRYLALGVCAFNLHKIGNQLLKEKQKKEKKKQQCKKAA